MLNSGNNRTIDLFAGIGGIRIIDYKFKDASWGDKGIK